MAEDKTAKETPAEEPHHAHGYGPEVEQLKEFLSRFGTPILAGVVVAMLMIVGFGTYRSFQDSNASQASLALADAESVEDFQSIISDFAKTPSVPIARLGLASEQFQSGDYEAAAASYAGFVKEEPDHPMVEAASIAQIQCLEAQGKLEEALEGFVAFMASYPDNYLVPFAGLGKARCLAELNRLEDARAAYEDLVAAHPESIWARRAENDLLEVERMLRARAGGQS
jgi:predicted negative regulator of RcsB-dependent stress response